MREIVDKCAGGDALVPCHSTILVGDRAIPEMNVGRGAIEANGAKTTALQLQSAIPFPRRGSSARSSDPQMDIRSMRPIPIGHEFAHVGRRDRTKRVGVYGTGAHDPKMSPRIEQSP